MLAVCFGRRREAQRWLRTMALLAARAGVPCSDAGAIEFEPRFLVAWLLVGADRQAAAALRLNRGART